MSRSGSSPIVGEDADADGRRQVQLVRTDLARRAEGRDDLLGDRHGVGRLRDLLGQQDEELVGRRDG